MAKKEFLRVFALLGCAFALALTGSQAVAQSIYAALAGTITDASGAVVGAAKIEIKNQGTQAVRVVVSDSAGSYRVPNLDAGSYTLTVSAPGFGTEERKDITLLARDTVRVDVPLSIAGASTQVDVKSEAEVVSENLTLSDSKSGNEINSLALNFRATNATSPIVVANLAPGVQPDAQGNISIAGGLPNSTSFSIDGISTQQVRFGGANTDMFPSVETIGEFRVNSAGNNAEFAQPTDLTVISKSGTNDFHGALFWFLQNDFFNAEDPFAGHTPKVRANDFGASVGGPIVIPHLYNGKNKTFFFFTYEGTRRPQQSLIDTTTPPVQWRNGDLSAASTIYEPGTATPFPGNQIPSGFINPTSVKILNAFFPLPTSSSPSIANPNLVTSINGNYTLDGYDGRIDQAINDNQKVFFRVTKKTLDSINAGGSSSYNPLLGPLSAPTDLTNLAGAYNWVIKPNLINEFRAGYSFSEYIDSYPQAAQGDALSTAVGIVGLPGPPKNGKGGVPDYSIGSFLGGDSNAVGRPRDTTNRVLDISDSVTWVTGAHTLKFGMDFRKLSYQDQITFTNGDEYGDYNFSGLFTGGGSATTASAFADFLLGIATNTDYARNGPDGKPYAYHYGFFGQDDWKLRRNLTMNFGIRYEVNPPFNDETNQLGNFNRNYPGGQLIVQGQQGLASINPFWKAAVGNTPFVTNQQVGLPDTLRYTYWRNIQPRLGFAWNPFDNNKTVVRASGGIYSVPILGATLYSLLGVNTSYYIAYASSATNPLILPYAFGGSALGISQLGYPDFRRGNAFNLEDPRVIQGNFAIDQDLGWGTLLRTSFTISHTTNLIYSPDLNQLQPNTVGYSALTGSPALRQANLRYPNFAAVLSRDNGPSAKYNAATVELNKRFSSGLNFQNNYTFTHNISNAYGSAPNSDSPGGEGGTGRGDNGDNVLNYYNIQADEGNVAFSRRNRFVSTILWDLPVGRGKKFMGNVSRGMDAVVGGWRVTTVTLLQSGPFLTPTFTGTDPSGTNPSGRSESGFQRPDCTGADPNASNPTVNQYFNPSAFTVPGNDIGRFGNCGVGILHGPGTKNLSMSIGKQFQLFEHLALRYEAQISNLFNIENYGIPQTQINSGNFGQVTAVQTAEQGGPRTIQMTLRFLW